MDSTENVIKSNVMEHGNHSKCNFHIKCNGEEIPKYLLIVKSNVMEQGFYSKSYFYIKCN